MEKLNEARSSGAASSGGSVPESGDELKGKAEEKAREAKAQVKDQAEEVKAWGKETAREARDVAEEQVDRRTGQAADRLDTVVRALHSAADAFDDDGQDWLADYTRQAASQVDRVTGYLRDEDTPSMLSDLEGMARSNPGTFLGTSFAAGLAAGRFLRSSKPRPERDEEVAGTGSERPGATPSRPAPGGRLGSGGTLSPGAGSRTGGSAMASQAAGGVPARGGEPRRDRGGEPQREGGA